MSDLRSRIEAELDRREAIARKLLLTERADPRGMAVRWNWVSLSGRLWVRDGDGDNVAEAATPLDADYIALHDPADALRRYQHARKVLERHALVSTRCETCSPPHDDGPSCGACAELDCPELLDLAESLGLEDR